MRTLPLAALLAASACGRPEAEAPGDDVVALLDAMRRGDVPAQLRSLVAREDANEHGARVLRELFPADQIRHFEPRSAELLGGRGDTAYWAVWGTEPDYTGVDYTTYRDVGGLSLPGVPREPSDAEVAALPRKRGSHVVVLVRRPDGWKLPLESVRLGPVLAWVDSVDARCPTGSDPRPCRPLLERVRPAFDSLPAATRKRFSYIPDHANHRIRESRAMDSLRLEVIGEWDDRATRFTRLDVVAVNRSAVDIRSVVFRVLDAEGSVIVPNWSVDDLHAHGRKEAEVLVEGHSYPRPVRLELTWVSLAQE